MSSWQQIPLKENYNNGKKRRKKGEEEKYNNKEREENRRQLNQNNVFLVVTSTLTPFEIICYVGCVIKTLNVMKCR